LEIREGCPYNHPTAEGRKDIAVYQKFKLEYVAFIATFVNRPAVTNRQLAKAIRNKFPSILFTRK
jgi:hypothetical protein